MSTIEARLREVPGEHVASADGTVTGETSFMDDLGVDELDTVELVMAFEESLGVTLAPGIARAIHTFGDAVAAFTNARGPASSAAASGSVSAEALCEQAAEYIADWMWPEAIEVLERAVAEAPQMARCHHLLGRAFAGAGDTDKSVAHYTTAWKAAIEDARTAGADEYPRLVSMTQGFTQELIKVGRARTAIPVANLTLGIAPNSPDLLYNLACAFAQCGDGEGAAEALGRAIALDPDQADDARDDSDFAPVREHPDMKRVLAG